MIQVTRTRNALSRYGVRFAKEMDAAVIEMAKAVAADARVTVPVDTGALRASLHIVAWRRGARTLQTGYAAAALASTTRAAYGGRTFHHILPAMPPPPRWTGLVGAPAAYAEYVEYALGRHFMQAAAIAAAPKLSGIVAARARAVG